MLQTIDQLKSRVMVLETLWFNAVRQQTMVTSMVPVQRHLLQQPVQAQNHGIGSIVQIQNQNSVDAQPPNASESEIEVIDVDDNSSE